MAHKLLSIPTQDGALMHGRANVYNRAEPICARCWMRGSDSWHVLTRVRVQLGENTATENRLHWSWWLRPNDSRADSRGHLRRIQDVSNSANDHVHGDKIVSTFGYDYIGIPFTGFYKFEVHGFNGAEILFYYRFI